MSTKGFMVLVVGVLVLGGIIGGAFVGGMVLGKSNAEGSVDNSDSFQLSSDMQNQLNQMRQQFQGTRVYSGTPSGTPGAQFFSGRGGLTGTITQINGDTVTVNTSQGPLEVKIGSDTSIQKTSEVTSADLQEGDSITVIGQRNDDGVTEATSISIVPEGTSFPFGGGGFPSMGQ